MKNDAPKLKIRSRPFAAASIGSGAITLNISVEALYLIAGLVAHCRLGQSSPYSAAALEVMTAIGNEYGDDFISDAADDMGLAVTIEDLTGNIITQSAPSAYITLEV